MLRVATGALGSFGDERRVQAQLRRGLVPERAHRRGVVVGERRAVEIELQRTARREQIDVRMTRPARAQHAHAARQRRWQERRERIATGSASARIGRRIILIEAIDQHDQALGLWQELALRDSLQRRLQPCRRMHAGIGFRLDVSRKQRHELRDQRGCELRRIVPVILAPADEMMWHRVARGLAPRQPLREQRALAHPRSAGHDEPAIDGLADQQLIELRQERGASHEARVSRSFCREVDPRRFRRC
ncbi:MAG: hypothetical protein ABIY55_04730 [Kofleriaceae bacterium]